MNNKILQSIKRGFLAAKCYGPKAAIDIMEDEFKFVGWVPTHEYASKLLATGKGIHETEKCYEARWVAYNAILEAVRISFDKSKGSHSKFGWKVANFVARCLTHGISCNVALEWAACGRIKDEYGKFVFDDVKKERLLSTPFYIRKDCDLEHELNEDDAMIYQASRFVDV